MTDEAVIFGKLPSAVVEAGALPRMTEADVKVYVAIISRMDGVAFASTLSVATMATLTGCHERTVQRSIERLRKLGLVRVDVGGGRKKPSVYRVNTTFD